MLHEIHARPAPGYLNADRLLEPDLQAEVLYRQKHGRKKQARFVSQR